MTGFSVLVRNPSPKRDRTATPLPPSTFLAAGRDKNEGSKRASGETAGSLSAPWHRQALQGWGGSPATRPPGPPHSSGLSLALILAEHGLDTAQGLAGAMLIFDQTEAHMGIAVIAETDARRYRHLGITQQLLAKLQ